MNDSGLVRVWGIDGETKAPEGLRGHQGPVYAASFSRDGKFILTGGADKSGRLWHVDRRRAIAPADQSQNWTTRLEELIQLAGKTAGRNLTTEEWSNSFPDADYQPTTQLCVTRRKMSWPGHPTKVDPRPYTILLALATFWNLPMRHSGA